MAVIVQGLEHKGPCNVHPVQPRSFPLAQTRALPPFAHVSPYLFHLHPLQPSPSDASSFCVLPIFTHFGLNAGFHNYSKYKQKEEQEDKAQ